MNLQNLVRTFIVAPIFNATEIARNYFQRDNQEIKQTKYSQETIKTLHHLSQKLAARKSRLHTSYSQTSEELVPESYQGSQRE